MARRAKQSDGDEFAVDRQLEDTLQQSAAQAAAADVLLAEYGYGNPYYDRKYGSSGRGRSVVTGPSKRKPCPYPYPETAARRDDTLTASTSSHRRREASRDRYSVDVAGSYSYKSSSPQKPVLPRELPEEPTLRSRRGQDVAEFRDRQERQSRFLEGSMNDKVSKRPPSVFIGDEQEYLLSAYMDEHNAHSNGWQPATCSQTPATPTLHSKKASLSSVKSANNADATEPRPSGVFRFGKAIVSAINPLGVWGNVSEIWKGHDSSSKGSASRELPVDTAHAARIEKAYQEYKASAAYRSTTPSTAPLHRYAYSREGTASPTKFLPAQTPQPQPSHRPSASIQSSTSKELPPTPLEWQGVPASTVSKRSSLQTIKNSRSFLNLSQSLRKEQSHKDLARENKLRKKVSNLEEKLLRYRRELSTFVHDDDKQADELEGDAHAVHPVQINNHATHQHYLPPTAGPSVPSAPSPAPVPPSHDKRYMRMRSKKFVPGALPSLPSERLLFDGEEPATIRELSEQESSPEKPIYTRRSEPRLRRAVPRIGEEDLIQTPTATIANRAVEGASTPPSRKRKSPSPDPGSIRRRRISATYSKNIRSNNNNNNIDNYNDNNNGASPSPSPRPNRHASTEKLTGPRPRPVNAHTEAEGRRNQPSRRAKDTKPVYYPNYDLATRPVPLPERSEPKPKHNQTPTPAPAKTPTPISTPALTPRHSSSSVSVEVAIPISAPPPIPSSTKPSRTPTSRQKPEQKKTADATAKTASVPPPQPEPVPTAKRDVISRSGSPKKHHNIPPRRKAVDKPITITPGRGDDENIPPVPPLPVEHGGSPSIEDDEFEWPEGIF
ncbi:hypothetical protein MGYG_01813 [Nannizzia gypsea CBS 118893]|uniref:Nuclear RNA binding protein n=1 Tax=Arthroderma gypseum (strain ATCC MYA-4604 / CBS 118893) TaxID=535722 RepID=E5R3J8_ARTGP|nr:hypothetical protein MGYG_01813 [Nannizzia gypsea CBS 118893]EFQ98797.1 hypothetical protein MGYG_01813 [Nannizzia gypsea CBS 118893]